MAEGLWHWSHDLKVEGSSPQKSTTFFSSRNTYSVPHELTILHEIIKLNHINTVSIEHSPHWAFIRPIYTTLLTLTGR